MGVSSRSMMAGAFGFGVVLLAGHASAALVVNAAQAITEKVTIQPIIVSDDSGTNEATFFGTAGQQAIIEAHIDTIWSQAGIDIVWNAPNTWNDSFAYEGTLSPRPTSDLNQVVSDGNSDGVSNADPLVLNMYFVRIAAGFAFTSENTANGLAFVGGNGITQFVGSALLTFEAGQEVIASVVSHEIGHNLGLSHITESQNLLQEGGSPNPGSRLNSSQITTALNSQYSVPIPEPSSLALLGLGGLFVARRRRAA